MFKNEVDTHSYKGWLNSDSFMKRALAVVGYSTAGTLILYAIILIPFLVVMLFFAFISNL